MGDVGIWSLVLLLLILARCLWINASVVQPVQPSCAVACCRDMLVTFNAAIAGNYKTKKNAGTMRSCQWCIVRSIVVSGIAVHRVIPCKKQMQRVHGVTH